MSDDDRVHVEGGWVVVNGCKVAKAAGPDALAFHDKCKRRSSARQTDQVVATLRELAAALIQAAEQKEAGDE